MAKRWTFEDDLFLAAYFDTLGDYIGEHDLGRPKGSAAKRVEKLKASGAWDVLQMHIRTAEAYRVALDLPRIDVGGDEDRRAFRTIQYCRTFFGGAPLKVVASRGDAA